MNQIYFAITLCWKSKVKANQGLKMRYQLLQILTENEVSMNTKCIAMRIKKCISNISSSVLELLVTPRVLAFSSNIDSGIFNCLFLLTTTCFSRRPYEELPLHNIVLLYD